MLNRPASLAMSTSVLKPCLVNLISKDPHLVFSLSRQASRCQQAFSTPCLVNLIWKDHHLVFSLSRQASRCQQAFSKPCLVNLISKDLHLVFSISVVRSKTVIRLLLVHCLMLLSFCVWFCSLCPLVLQPSCRELVVLH